MPQMQANDVACSICHNVFPGVTRDSQKRLHCPFCRSTLDPAPNGVSLDEIIGFKVLAVLDSTAGSKFYVALHESRKFLVALVDETSMRYSTFAMLRKRGQAAALGSDEVIANPDPLRIYPVSWKGEVAVLVMDYTDGKSLEEWVHALGVLSISDAITIMFKSLRLSKELGAQGRREQLVPASIRIQDNGEVKFTFEDIALFDQHSPPSKQLMSGGSPEDWIARGEKLKRLSTHYSAPEYDSHMERTARYTLEQLDVQRICGLGALFYELLVDGRVPRIDGEVRLVQRFDLIPVHENRKDATRELSQIVDRMIAFDPVERYQTYDEVIADLKMIDIETDRVSFVELNHPMLARRAAVEKVQWLHRGEADDFRKIKWGMSHEEVQAIESDNLTHVMPFVVSLATEYSGMALHVNYQFVLDEDERRVCAFASVMPSNLCFTFVDWQTDSENGVNRRGIEDCIDLKGRDEHKELLAHTEKLLAQANRLLDSGYPEPGLSGLTQGKFDVAKLMETYQQLKELFTIEYGAPFVEDGPIQEDPSYIEEVAKSDGVDLAEVMQYCQSTIWKTERTYGTLDIIPGPFHSRMIVGKFISREHGGDRQMFDIQLPQVSQPEPADATPT